MLPTYKSSDASLDHDALLQELHGLNSGPFDTLTYYHLSIDFFKFCQTSSLTAWISVPPSALTTTRAVPLRQEFLSLSLGRP